MRSGQVDWARVKALILDLDGTLYDSPELLAVYPRLAVRFTAERLGLAPEEAEQRFAAQRESLHHASGTAPSTTAVVVSLTGAPPADWGAYVAGEVDPAAYLDPQAYSWMHNVIDCLRRYYRLAIVTNNHRTLAGRILDLLGIAGCFDAVLSAGESGRIKPDSSLYTDAARMLDVPPEACLAVGDRLAVDVAPGQAVGMQGLVVSGPQDLHALCADLLRATGAHEPAAETVQG